MWLVNGTNHGHRVLAVKYEDMKKNSLAEVKRMLSFLRFPYKEKELQRRLAAGNMDLFHRYILNIATIPSACTSTNDHSILIACMATCT